MDSDFLNYYITINVMVILTLRVFLGRVSWPVYFYVMTCIIIMFYTYKFGRIQKKISKTNQTEDPRLPFVATEFYKMKSEE